jgi:hypothetical protein
MAGRVILFGWDSMRRAAWVCAVTVLGALILFQAKVWMNLKADQQYLTHLMDTIADPALPPSAQTLALLGYLREKPPQTNRAYFLNREFAFLRPTAREVAENGGNCADRSRFVVVMLKIHGIHASKWALYAPNGRPAHAVVEVDSEQGKMVADPLYGIWFPKPGGGFYGIQELRNNPEILKQRLGELRAAPLPYGVMDIRKYPLDHYVYSDPRTVNWDKSAITHHFYGFLHALFGARINQITRPEWSEQPADMVLLMSFALEVILFLALIPLFFYRKRVN